MRRSFIYIKKKAVVDNAIEVVYRTTIANETIIIPAVGTNDLVIDWDDGSALETVTSTNPSHVYATPGDHIIKINGSLSLWSSYTSTASRGKLISVNKFDCPAVGITDMSNAFYSCGNLITVNNVYTSGVIIFEKLFGSCARNISFNNIADWDVSSGTNHSLMFNESNGITSLDLSKWDVSNSNSLFAMFATNSTSAFALTTVGDLSGWVMQHGCDLRNMFYNKKRIVESAPDWWNSGLGYNGNGCFTFNYDRPNYGSIPELWR